MLKKLSISLCFVALFVTNIAKSADYVIDTEGAHAFINFKVSHLGYSFVLGTFKDFSGDFSFDAKDLSKTKFNVTVNVASLFTNHNVRDEHLTGKDYLNTDTYKTATFTSSKIEPTGKNKDGKSTFKLYGYLNLMGVTKEIVIDSVFIGAGADPWGGQRAGFEGYTELNRKDFGKQADLGPTSDKVELYIVVEGIKK